MELAEELVERRCRGGAVVEDVGDASFVPGCDGGDVSQEAAVDIVDVVRAELFAESGYNRRGVRTWDDRELARLGI